jgi:hypothetical protein
MISSIFKKNTLIFFIVILATPSILEGNKLVALGNQLTPAVINSRFQSAKDSYQNNKNSARALCDNLVGHFASPSKVTPPVQIENLPGWYNKLYRQAIEHGPQVALNASLLVVAWYFLWFRTDRGTRPENQSKIRKLIPFGAEDEYMEVYVNSPTTYLYSNLECAMRDFFGAYYHEGSGHHYDGRNPLGPLGTIEKKISDYQHGLSPLVAVIALLLYAYRKEVQHAIHSSKDELYKMHNKWMFGAGIEF